MKRGILAFGAVVAIVFAAEARLVAGEFQPATVSAPAEGSVDPKAGTRPPARQRRAPRKAPAPKLSAVQLRLQRDAPLAQAVLSRLPAGTELMAASAGFTEVGHFVAAVNASRALGVPLRELRRRMVGDRMPLLLAIQDLRPRSNYRQTTRRVEDEAAAIMSAASNPPITLAKRKS